MGDDPHRTVKFAKVVAIGTPSPLPASETSEMVGDRLSQPNPVPEGSDDEVLTPRSIPVAVAAPDIPSSPDRPLLRVLAGLNAGQVFTLDGDEVLIGRGSDAQVRIDEAGISRRHARIVRTKGRRHVLEDLGSTNGVFVNGRRVERVDLADGDRVQIGPTAVLRFGLVAADEEALARNLFEGSTRDALTRLYNRKYACERLAAEVAYVHRHGTLLSVALFDIDHFKRVNDTFGHPAGDIVLRIVAAQAQKAIRREDVLARYGGEEFLVLVRGIEPRGVGILADRVRKAIERLAIPWESRTLRTTVSGGVASLSECGPKGTAEELVAMADERLYKAKAAGRNRVC